MWLQKLEHKACPSSLKCLSKVRLWQLGYGGIITLLLVLVPERGMDRNLFTKDLDRNISSPAVKVKSHWADRNDILKLNFYRTEGALMFR